MLICWKCRRETAHAYRTAPVGESPARWMCAKCHPAPPDPEQFDRDLDAALRGEDE